MDAPSLNTLKHGRVAQLAVLGLIVPGPLHINPNGVAADKLKLLQGIKIEEKQRKIVQYSAVVLYSRQLVNTWLQ